MRLNETPWFRLTWNAEGTQGGGGADPAPNNGDGADPDDGDRKDDPADPADKGSGGIEFPDNWREDFVGKLGLEGEARKRALEQAKRWASPYDAFKSAYAAQSKISELTEKTKGLVKLPGKDATPEEIAAYHKARGAPDSPEGYTLTREKDAEGNEIQPSEMDRLLEGEFLKTAHKLGLNQAEVDGFWNLYNRLAGMAQQHLEREAQALAQQTEDNLRTEWLKDYSANVELANRFLAEHMGPDGVDFLTKKLEGGSTVGSYEPFVRMIVNLARIHADDGILISGDLGGGVNIDQRINEIYALRQGSDEDRKKYASKEIQDELMRLTNLQNRRKKQNQAAGATEQ